MAHYFRCDRKGCENEVKGTRYQIAILETDMSNKPDALFSNLGIKQHNLGDLCSFHKSQLFALFGYHQGEDA